MFDHIRILSRADGTDILNLAVVIEDVEAIRWDRHRSNRVRRSQAMSYPSRVT